MSEIHSTEISSGEEVWRDVVGYEGKYQVSTLGRIKSVARTIFYTQKNGSIRKHSTKERIRKINPPGPCCRQVCLSSQTHKVLKVSHLVLEAFVGPRPEGKECCHWDGNSFNNCLSNLRWDTHVENMRDMDRHGRIRRGEFNPRSKLTTEAVRDIRKRFEHTDKSANELAELYRVHVVTIREVVRRKNWRHI